MGELEFKRFLDEQRSTTEPQIDWDKRKDEWLSNLREFFDLVKNFLQEYIDSDQVKLDWTEKTIRDDPIKPYSAKQLHILIKGKKVILDPIGTILIGANGRIDMKGSRGSVRFVLVPRGLTAPGVKIASGAKSLSSKARKDEETPSTEWEWKIATSPPAVKYIEFSKDSFFDSLMKLIK